MKKKLLSVMFALSMLLSFIPAASAANDSDKGEIHITYAHATEELLTLIVELSATDSIEGRIIVAAYDSAGTLTALKSYYAEDVGAIPVPLGIDDKIVKVFWWANITDPVPFSNYVEIDLDEVQDPIPTPNPNITWSLADGVLTISGTGNMDDYNVNRCSPWYGNKNDVEFVVIEDGVTSIGEDAFLNCSNLLSITIPDSVTSIGGDAFCGCNRLTNITIPDNVAFIGSGAFYNCNSLTSITIPAGVTSINWLSFTDCDSLTSITIPNSVTSIARRAFSYCISLKTVYYTGTKAEWDKISIDDYNTELLSANIIYNYTGE